MWEILPDSGTVRAMLEWLAFVVVVILMLGVGFFGLAFGAMGLEKVRREGKKLLGRSDVLAVAGELAAVDVTGLRRYVDVPDDVLILLIANPAAEPCGAPNASMARLRSSATCRPSGRRSGRAGHRPTSGVRRSDCVT
jgi:hypothetical protein